jgi:hypothetical protein
MLVSYIMTGSNSLANVQTDSVILSTEDRMDGVDGSQRDPQAMVTAKTLSAYSSPTANLL